MLPINLQSNYTINFWIDILGTNQSDLRIFAEDDFNGNSNPLWVVGTGGGGGSSLDANLHWLRRQQGITINGLTQGPDAVGTQNDSYTSLNPCDGNWHMFTITKQFTNNLTGSNVENFEVYVDTVLDPGNSGSASFATHLDAFGSNAVLLPEPVTNQNHPPVAWTWLINATSFGGLSRSITGGNYITGQLDDAAMWNRVLSPAELTNLYQYGLTNVSSSVQAGISSFSFDASEVLYGDKVALRWTTTHATTVTISPNIGDVTSITVNGAGSTNLTITSNVTYTIVSSRPGSAATNSASVKVSKEAVAANWHLIERFDSSPLSAPGIGGIPTANWVNILGDFTGSLDYFYVASETNTNSAITISNSVGGTAPTGNVPKGALSAYLLNGSTVQSGATNTVFFRFYVADPSLDQNDFSFFFGLTDVNKQPLAVSSLDGFDTGPKVNITRTLSGTANIIDVIANNGPSGFTYTNATTTNASSTAHYITTNPAGLTPGIVYDFWIDIFDKPFGSTIITNSDTTTTTNLNSGTFFSVYFKALGDTTRTELFTNFLSDRYPFGTVPPPLAPLGQLFLMLDSQAQNANLIAVGTNTVVIDDLYISKTNLNATIPVPPGVFPDLIVPTSIGLHNLSFLANDPSNGNNPSTTLSWSSIPGATYSVYKTSGLPVPGAWQLVTTELLSGGANTTFKDTASTGAGAYYRISSP